MALKSFSKDYLLSSTPLQSPGDSGYFGSGQRRNNAVVLNSCSPIKESTHKTLPENIHFMHDLSPRVKFNQNLSFENVTRNESFPSIEINELSELEVASSNFSSQFELYKTSQSSLFKEGHKIHDQQGKSYSNFGYFASTSHSLNSLSADNDINYKLFDFASNDKLSSSNLMYHEYSENEICESRNVVIFNRKKVDFIRELLQKNCHFLISYILSFLSAKELCMASCVSKEWNNAVMNDSKAKARKQDFITERLTFLNGPSKENRKGMKYGPAKEHKNVLSDLTNIEISLNSANMKVSNSNFESFITESKNSRLKLLKCPKCFHASKRVDQDRYTCTRCSYNFCSICLDPFYTSHTCFKPQIPNIVVGSKKSKRNLRRL